MRFSTAPLANTSRVQRCFCLWRRPREMVCMTIPSAKDTVRTIAKANIA